MARFHAHAILMSLRRSGAMKADPYVGGPQSTLSRGKLFHDSVQVSAAQPLGSHGIAQGALVDQFPARDVRDAGAGPQQDHPARVDETSCPLGLRPGEDAPIALGQQVVEPGEIECAVETRRGDGHAGHARHLQTQRLQLLADLRPDLLHCEDHHTQLAQFLRPLCAGQWRRLVGCLRGQAMVKQRDRARTPATALCAMGSSLTSVQLVTRTRV